jgi:hypothetical protein
VLAVAAVGEGHRSKFSIGMSLDSSTIFEAQAGQRWAATIFEAQAGQRWAARP